MAEGGYENGFENSENFQYVLFTEHLVNYVMRQNVSDLVGERFPIPSHRFADVHFNVTIKKAIYILGKDLEGIHMDYFNQMYQNDQISSFHYVMLVRGLKRSLFVGGFSGRYFLVYCAGISNLAAYFYICGIHDAPNLAKFHIFNILRNLMPAEGWNIVNMAAEKFIQMFRQ